MFSVKKGIFFTIALFASSNLLAADSSVLGDRQNVMECSFDEVAAYMDLPDPKRKVMSDYNAWTRAYKSTESVKAESDPRVCLSVLYGDLSAMGEQLKSATGDLMAMQTPGMGEVLSRLSDKLMESICSRVEVVRDAAAEAVIEGIDDFRSQAQGKLRRRYGINAMEKYITNSVIPPEFKEAGIRYRNGKIDRSRFRRKVKGRWSKELDELRDDAVDDIAGGD